MKKLYFLVILAFMATTSFAQRSVNLEMQHLYLSDTIKIDSPMVYPTFVVYGIKNLGPDTIAASDTVHLLTRSGAEYYFLLNSGYNVGDTLISIDTFYFTGGPVTGTVVTWCDSTWITGTSANPVMEPSNQMANNKHCETAVIKNFRTTSVSELFGSKKRGNGVNTLNVFPNPATNNVSFTYNFRGDDANVLVRDITGRIVYQQTIGRTYGEKTISVDVANFSNGLYIVELNTENSRSVGRVLIQK